ncbi:hypothetical protein LPJ57_007255, partial [Coemansia sp. RSA 486]
LTNGGRFDPPADIPDSEFALVDHSLYSDSEAVACAEPIAPRPLTAVSENAQPDSTWLTAQMLSSREEISMLVSATNRASKSSAKPYNSRLSGGSVEIRTIKKASHGQRRSRNIEQKT